MIFFFYFSAVSTEKVSCYGSPSCFVNCSHGAPGQSDSCLSMLPTHHHHHHHYPHCFSTSNMIFHFHIMPLKLYRLLILDTSNGPSEATHGAMSFMVLNRSCIKWSRRQNCVKIRNIMSPFLVLGYNCNDSPQESIFVTATTTWRNCTWMKCLTSTLTEYLNAFSLTPPSSATLLNQGKHLVRLFFTACYLITLPAAEFFFFFCCCCSIVVQSCL